MLTWDIMNLFLSSYFTFSNQMPHFETYLFVDKEKSEKYSINLCVRNRVVFDKIRTSDRKFPKPS